MRTVSAAWSTHNDLLVHGQPMTGWEACLKKITRPKIELLITRELTKRNGKKWLGTGRKTQERKAQKNVAKDSEEIANDECVSVH